MEDSSKKEFTFWDWSNIQDNTAEHNEDVVNSFAELCNQIPELKKHRDFIEESQLRFNMIYGHGHRSLQYLWKLLVDEMPSEFSFLEIGVYKGQILSLIEMLTKMSGKRSAINGVTPLFDPEFAPYDRGPFITNIYKQFNLDQKNTAIFNGRSGDPEVIKKISSKAPFDMVYIDGDHSYDGTVLDIETYGPMVQSKGFLIIDDCNTYKNMPDGLFSGIDTVSDAVRNKVETDKSFREVLTCMHVRVWQKEQPIEDLMSPEEFWSNLYAK